MRPLLLALFGLLAALAPAQVIPPGVPVSYELPSNGPLPQTYRVTLAIVDAKNPAWIISQFAAGVVRTVTAENGGKFTETWNGLDDNFMPVPPGTYALKGIYMPAAKWAVDGEYHSITPRYITSADAWRARPGEAKPPIVVGDPVNSPLGDVDVGANGVGVFCYQYLENARNFYAADFNKPISYDQASPGFNSGGAAGGKSVATDQVLASGSQFHISPGGKPGEWKTLTIRCVLPPTAGFLVVHIGAGSAGQPGQASPKLGEQFADDIHLTLHTRQNKAEVAAR